MVGLFVFWYNYFSKLVEWLDDLNFFVEIFLNERVF